ncbi:MAG: alpha/beta fold hydrolase [Actinophytocola sp.]|uniref:thioesterase II family protein n=1 Tax=Actinophytocola sp. TaxID=1872138 RepID=UPI003C70AFA3
MGATSGAWLHCPRPRPDARLRLVCLPYAGGDVTAYWPWLDLLGDEVEMWCAQLPGRGRRFTEPPATEPGLLVGPLTEAVLELVRPPYVLFGHSMGALLGFELARRLDGVARLVVSAARAPHVPLHGDPHLLGDAELIAWLTELGGVPAELLANTEMLELLLPTLRADLTVCAAFLDEGAPLDVPITVITPDADPLVPVDHATEWRRYTTAACDLVVRPGGHFYLLDDPLLVLDEVARTTTAKEGAR